MSAFPKFSSLGDESASIAKRMASWDFNVLEFSPEELLVLSYRMFKNLGVLKMFNINTSIFKRFLLAIRAHYANNPYHNFYHAVDVLHASYYLLTTSKGCFHLKPIDVLALAIAAFCHDVGHPGLNNFFERNTSSQLAILYNDASILENFHSSITFTIMARPEVNFSSHFDPETYGEFRRSVIHSVLATDMGQHFDFITKLKERVDTGVVFSPESVSDRFLLMSGIIKCSDISNPIRNSPQVSEQWARSILSEYFAQGDLERSLKLPVFPLGDRQNADVGRAQLDFIRIMLRPLYEQMAVVLPDLAFRVNTLNERQKAWEEMLASTNVPFRLPLEETFRPPVSDIYER